MDRIPEDSGMRIRSSSSMFLDWFTLAGFVSVFGLFALLIYVCKTRGCGS